jgi:hypothetical protein
MPVSTNLMHTPESPLEQYEKLICEPLKDLRLVGKVVVVIDALDECDDYREVIEALSRSDIHPNIRILVTSRSEHDIVDALRSHSHIGLRHLSVDEPGIEEDILEYLNSQFENARISLDPEEIYKLAQKADGLFQWAYTACRYITNQSGNNGKRRVGTNARTRYKMMLSVDDKLDGLYRVILLDAFTPDEEERKPVLAALAMILATSVPLPLSALIELCPTEEVRDVMERDIPMLGSVFDIHPSTSIRPLHTSFRDYLTDPNRSDEFFVDLILGHQHLALGVFIKMNQELRFNVFDIRTSHQDFAIDHECHPFLSPASALHYSCRYWMDHLGALDASGAVRIKELVEKFMTEKLLFWLEVMCAAKCLDNAARAMEDVSSGPWVCSSKTLCDM